MEISGPVRRAAMALVLSGFALALGATHLWGDSEGVLEVRCAAGLVVLLDGQRAGITNALDSSGTGLRITVLEGDYEVAVEGPGGVVLHKWKKYIDGAGNLTVLSCR